MKQAVDFLGGHFATHFEDRIGQRTGQQGNADGVAVELPFEFRVDQGDGGGAAGGGGDQRHPRRPRPAQILVRRVDDHLGVGGIVDGGNDAVLDADLFMQNFHHRSQAVGGAAGGGEQMVLDRVVEVVVDPHDDVQRPLFDRGGDDHLFHPAIIIGLQQLGGAKLARRFDDDIDPQLIPGDLARRFVLTETDPLAIDGQRGLVKADRPLPAAVHRVELQQMGGALGPAFDFVDMHDLELRPVQGGAQRQTTHTAKAVNAHTNAHR